MHYSRAPGIPGNENDHSRIPGNKKTPPGMNSLALMARHSTCMIFNHNLTTPSNVVHLIAPLCNKPTAIVYNMIQNMKIFKIVSL